MSLKTIRSLAGGKPWKTVRNLAGGVGGKFAMILILMASLTGASAALGNYIFRTLGTELEAFTDEQVPNLRDSSAVTLAAGGLKNALTELILADDQQGLDEAAETTSDALSRLETAIGQTSEEGSAALLPLLIAAQSDLDELIAARSDEFTNQTRIDASVAELTTLNEEAGRILTDLGDGAYFRLHLGGDATISAVRKTLEQLVGGDFVTLQTVLQIRAEINLLSGAVLAMAQNNDQEVVAMMRDVSESSVIRLGELAPQLAVRDGVQPEQMVVLERALEYFKKALKQDLRFAPNSRREALTTLQASETVLATLLDDLFFTLEIRGEEAADANHGAIKELLDGQVARLRDLATLDVTVKKFLVAALAVATAPDRAALNSAKKELASASEGLEARVSAADENIQPLLEKILAVADPRTGVIVKRGAVLTARGRAVRVSRNATDSVRKIDNQAVALGAGSLDQISSASTELRNNIKDAEAGIFAIAIACLILVPAALLLTWRLIIRPLRALTQVTQRLSQGDLDAVVEPKRYGGELRQMADALVVFRDNLIEKIRLEKEEEEARVAEEAMRKKMREEEERREAEAKAEEERRERAEREEAERVEREKREREEREREMLAEEERKRRELKEAEEAEREAMRKAAEEERAARMAEQSLVVESLADGLKRLANGDLSAEIDTEFTEGYEQLRLDFNSAIVNLRGAMGAVLNKASGIRGGAGDMNQAAEDLSRRTENQAATLEETAAALEELTVSVKAAADSASKADEITADAKSSAEASEVVVKETIDAMGKIEKSSDQISQIIGVIDEIAFQTNLLALNAGVEAARAGEAGRGFAVVASEVRALAQRCSNAAKEIKELISQSTQQVAQGVGLADRTGEALEKIVKTVGAVSVLVSEISSAAKQQSTGLGEINSAMTQLDQVTQQNAAMVQETTRASQDLNKDANELNTLMARFTLDDGSEAEAEADWMAVESAVEEGKAPEKAAAPRPRAKAPAPVKPALRAEGSAAVAADDDDWEDF